MKSELFFFSRRKKEVFARWMQDFTSASICWGMKFRSGFPGLTDNLFSLGLCLPPPHPVQDLLAFTVEGFHLSTASPSLCLAAPTRPGLAAVFQIRVESHYQGPLTWVFYCWSSKTSIPCPIKHNGVLRHKYQVFALSL